MNLFVTLPLARRRIRGAALIETVVAAAIIGITGAGVLGAFTSGFLMIRMTRENQRATQIILEKVETLRLYSWDQLNTVAFVPTTFTNTYDPQASADARGIVYRGSVIITNAPFAASYSDDMRQVTVTLSWTTVGVQRERSLSTLVAKDGLQNYVY